MGGERPRTRARSSDLLALGALGVAVLTIATGWTERTRLSHAVLDAGPFVNRTLMQDALIGAAIHLPELRRYGGSVRETVVLPQGRNLLWFLDAERCHGCLSDVGSWNRLVEEAGLSAALVLVGEEDPSFASSLRALEGTRVLVASPSQVRPLLGPQVPPSTKLLSTPTGTVLLADVRYSGYQCGWSFEGQVGAVTGVRSALFIRDPAGSPIPVASAGALPSPF